MTSVGRPFYVYLAQDTHDTLEVGEKMGFGGMVFPNIEADVTWEVTKPSGDLVVVNGRSSRLGIVRGQRLIPLDEPGLYRIRGTVHYGEYHGSVPGNYDGTFWHCAVEPNREILIDTDLAATQTIDENGLRIPISWPDDLNDVRVHYGVIMPGRILDQGDVAPRGGSWEYPFYPKNLAAQHPNLDVRNFATGEWELADTLIFQFFLEGTRGDQKMYDSLRLVLRDNRLYNFEKLLAHRGSE
ncbi:MAG: hypothetical protein M5R36_14085 [Deltaproteobacteria bacterium]|nr:hypothetical protein [Deltaproteobacteria bacterium]